jgi:hypothetical protein
MKKCFFLFVALVMSVTVFGQKNAKENLPSWIKLWDKIKLEDSTDTGESLILLYKTKKGIPSAEVVDFINSHGGKCIDIFLSCYIWTNKKEKIHNGNWTVGLGTATENEDTAQEPIFVFVRNFDFHSDDIGNPEVFVFDIKKTDAIDTIPKESIIAVLVK